MIAIRRATISDYEQILQILKDRELEYPSLNLDNFWIAEDGNIIVSITRFEDIGNCYFISSVGTKKDFEGKGLASKLIKKISNQQKDVYLYTIIPDFFEKLGFKTVKTPPFLPRREVFNCKDCSPNVCVCMIRRAE